MARLIIVAGLPGVGKTTVASILAQRMDAVHLSVDDIEESLLGAGLPPGWEVGVAAYEAARAVAERNLALGHDVVVDAVNDSDAARETWRRAAQAVGGALEFVHLVASDLQEHRRRLARRDRGFDHVGEPSWDAVARRREAYEPWAHAAREYDTSELSPETVVAQLIAHLASDRHAPRP